MASFGTNDRVSFEKDGKTLTGRVVAYSDNVGGRVYVIQCGPGEGPESRYHVPESFLREPTDAPDLGDLPRGGMA